LTAERSIAVDRAYVALGIPVWLEADEQFATADSVRRLMVAQDTGVRLRALCAATSSGVPEMWPAAVPAS